MPARQRLQKICQKIFKTIATSFKCILNLHAASNVPKRRSLALWKLLPVVPKLTLAIVKPGQTPNGCAIDHKYGTLTNMLARTIPTDVFRANRKLSLSCHNHAVSQDATTPRHQQKKPAQKPCCVASPMLSSASQLCFST